MKARFTTGANDELISAIRHYENEQEGLGDRFSAKFHESYRAIQDQPQSFPRIGDSPTQRELRYKQLHRFPYSIVYEVLADEIVILAVAHHSRRPGYWKRRRG